jgi:hypothetical protein
MRSLIVALVLCLVTFVQAEPNDVNLPVIPDANLIAPGDGFLLGYMVNDKSGNESLVKAGYQYGVSQFSIIGEVEKQKYFELCVKWESRDIAKENSVPALSSLILLIAPEQSEITGTAGLSRSWDTDKDESFWNTIGGINIRPNEDKNLLIELEGVTPIDRDIYFRAGIVWKF